MKKMGLGALRKGQKGQVIAIGQTQGTAEFAQRLMEMGFLEGAWVEVIHEAPFGGDPLAVRVRGTLLALRRREANAIEVEVHE